MTIQQMIDFLSKGIESGLFKADELAMMFFWSKWDAEQILNVELTDNEWNYLTGWVMNKSDWLYDDVHSDIQSKYDIMKEMDS